MLSTYSVMIQHKNGKCTVKEIGALSYAHAERKALEYLSSMPGGGNCIVRSITYLGDGN